MHSVYSFAFLDICTWIVNIIRSLLRSKNNPSAISWRVYDSCERSYIGWHKYYCGSIALLGRGQGSNLQSTVLILWILRFAARAYDGSNPSLRVNLLSVGTPISTTALEKNGRRICLVSIPYLSGHPFLQGIAKMRENNPKACVNPLSIGTPISTLLSTTDSLVSDLCQSPIYRDTHFYKAHL